jgi:hypothetical protein
MDGYVKICPKCKKPFLIAEEKVCDDCLDLISYLCENEKPNTEIGNN